MKKLDAGVQKAILRLKMPENQRVTANLREAAEMVAMYVAALGVGVKELPGGYRVQVLQSQGAAAPYLVKGAGHERRAIIAQDRPLWDAEGAVQAANTEHIRLFAKEVGEGLLEAIGEQLGRGYTLRLKEVAALLGKGEFRDSSGPLRRASDWDGEMHA